MKTHFAKTFRSDLTLAAIVARLNELGPWAWLERDNDRWGPYLSCAPTGELRGGVVKILADGGTYVVNVAFRSDATGDEGRAALATWYATLFERLLPAIGARELADTDTYE